MPDPNLFPSIGQPVFLTVGRSDDRERMTFFVYHIHHQGPLTLFARQTGHTLKLSAGTRCTLGFNLHHRHYTVDSRITTATPCSDTATGQRYTQLELASVGTPRHLERRSGPRARPDLTACYTPVTPPPDFAGNLASRRTAMTDWRSAPKSAFARVHDLGPGGVGLLLLDPLPLNRHLHVELILGDTPFQALGRIVHVQTGDIPAHTGLIFIGLEDSARQTLQRYILHSPV